MKKHIGAIWAQSMDAVIGVDGKIPWRIPGDLKYFKEQTEGCTVVMGRRTWESLPVKPLPGRDNIVVTSDRRFRAHGVEVARSIAEAVEMARARTVWIIGGERMYSEAMAYADELVVTTVDVMCAEADAPADLATAPHIYGHLWNVVWFRRDECPTSGLTFTVRHYLRNTEKNPKYQPGDVPH